MMTKNLGVAVIEPVGSHGGMDYYDSGLCGGLSAHGVPVVWYTCDISQPCGNNVFAVCRPFVQIWGPRSAWRRGLRYVKGLLGSIRNARVRQAAIAHFHFFHVGLLEAVGVLLARIYGLKVVATIHDVESFKPDATSKILRNLTYSFCSRLIVHNAVSCEELKKSGSISKEKIRIVSHGSYIDLVPPPIPKEKARQRINLPLHEKVILFFGQIKEVKGLDLLIEAVGLAKDELKTVHLVIAGKVWKDNFDRYQELINSYNLGDRCHLHIRYVPDEEIPNFYCAADLIVLPYRRIYQSGVLLMAMSYGIPILASDLPGMKEIITDGKNGFLFQAHSAQDLRRQLVRVLCGTTDKERVIQQAYTDMIQGFGWKAVAARTIAVYQEVL